jgi:hypothetical protein
MNELDKGHRYELANLGTPDGSYPEGTSVVVLQFYKDAAIHGGRSVQGPSTQEVLRACIARVKALEEEKPCRINAQIIFHLRAAIAGFEQRALMRSVEKGCFVEEWPVNSHGHLFTGEF